MIIGAVLDAEGDLVGSHAAALVESSGLTVADFDGRERLAWQLITMAVAKRKAVIADVIWNAGMAAKLFAGEKDRDWLRGLQSNNNLTREAFSEVVASYQGALRSKKLRAILAQHVADLDGRRADSAEVSAKLDGQLRELTSLAAEEGTGADDVLELGQEWERQERDDATPLVVPTGIEIIDAMIGGWRPNLNVVAGLPSVGKSGFLATCMDRNIGPLDEETHTHATGLKVGLFGLEEGTMWFQKRLMARDMRARCGPRADGSEWSVGDVLVRKRTPMEQEAYQEIAAVQHARMKNLITWKYSINIDALIARATHWIVNLGVQIIYVDHGGEIKHGKEFDEFRLAVAESYRRLRDLGVRYNVPIVVLAHTTRESDDENVERPPRPKEIAETAYVERMARVIIGLWKRRFERDVLRATIIKANDSEPDVTAKLDRLTKAAMLDPLTGERVNLEQERRDEMKKAGERKAAEQARIKELKAAEAEKLKAAKLAEKNKKKPQIELLGGAPGGDNA